MAVDAISPAASSPAPASAQDTATSAFNLNFESLLKIIMTQLTYQDPLKPMDNAQFVSQLAQFSQIQIGQNANDMLQQLASAQATLRATSLLGRSVDVPAGSTTLSGKVVSISFATGTPTITIKTSDGNTISNIGLAAITQVKEGN